MSRRALLLLAVLATCAECRRPGGGAARGGPLLAAEPIVVRNAGFERPESVFHDPFSDVYFVSNAPADSRTRRKCSCTLRAQRTPATRRTV